MKKSRAGMDRRGFIKASAIGLAGVGTTLRAGAAPSGVASGPENPRIQSYRTLGRTGFKVSDIGLGTARAHSAAVMAAAFDAGVNYIDTAEGYGRGASEQSIGEAIQGRDRSSLFITTKIWMSDKVTKEQVVERVHRSLERLQTDYIDCLMNQGAPTAESLKNKAFHQGMEQLKKEGKVRFVGVANHGPRMAGQGELMEDVLTAAVDDGRYDVLLLVHNFLQREAGEKVLEAAERKNVGATIMKSNPLGRYHDMKERIEQMKREGQEIDERMQQSWTRMEETAAQAQAFIREHGLEGPAEIKAAALKFILGDPRAHSVCLAIDSFDDVRDYVGLSGSSLNAEDRGLLADYARDCGRLYCRHACGVCEPSCPKGVPVNTIMRYAHYFDAQGNEKFAMEQYAGMRGASAEVCRTCPGFCEQACPHGVPVRGLLVLAHAQMSLTPWA